MDDRTTVAALRATVREFVDARQWRPFHDPKNLTCSIAIEAAELVEIYQWLSSDQALAAGDDPAVRQRTREELADVLIYCLSLANALDIDLSRAVEDKMARNEVRYPAAASRGRLGAFTPEDKQCPSN